MNYVSKTSAMHDSTRYVFVHRKDVKVSVTLFSFVKQNLKTRDSRGKRDDFLVLKRKRNFPIWLNTMTFKSRQIIKHQHPFFSSKTRLSSSPYTLLKLSLHNGRRWSCSKENNGPTRSYQTLAEIPFLPCFHSVSVRLVSGQDLQVSGCDIRDPMLSTPNRLHKDRRQKDRNKACAFICLGKEKGRE